MFVVDSVRKLDNDTRYALQRLNKIIDDPRQRRILDKLDADESFDNQLIRGELDISEEELDYTSVRFPQILVLNKVDLVTNKQKLLKLQHELEDLGSFHQVFHVSATTGFGFEALIKYFQENAKPKEWKSHHELVHNKTEAEKIEELVK